MKGNFYRRLYRPDYFGWKFYCQKSALRCKRFDKQRAKEKARIARKTMPIE